VTQERVHAVEQELARGADVTTLLTERPGHGVELAAAVVDADAVVVFSGDGGFNEALNGLAVDVPVGFLPGGRTSVLPRALGLPRDPVRAAGQLADALAEGRSRTISLGRVNGRRFAFAADELIHTEYSYKYAVPEFRALAARAGFRPVDTWTDPAELFSVHYFRLR